MLAPDCRDQFFFERDTVYLDHGGYGAVPRSVHRARLEKLAHIEQAPRMFDYEKAWHETRALIAARFHAEAKDVAIVDNAMDGINAVLRSQNFAPGDEILITSMTYHGVDAAARYFAGQRGLQVTAVPLDFAHPDPDYYVRAVGDAITSRTKLAILDHIASRTALVMPLAAMIVACRARRVPVLVDGAHAPGQVALNIPALRADWYVANLHKWYFAPRGCGFLWAAPDRQENLKPNIMAASVAKPFPDCFEWTGTRDPTTWLSVPDAFAFMDGFGAEHVLAHNHGLIRQGVAILENEWGLSLDIPDTMTGSFRTALLPELPGYPATKAGCDRLQADLWRCFKVVALAPLCHAGRIGIRLSAQIYNDLGDFKKLAEALHSLRK